MIGFDAALDGMHRAQTQITRTSHRLAQWSIGELNKTDGSPEADRVDLSDEMVSLINNRNTFEANVKSARTADEMARAALSMFDEKAYAKQDQQAHSAPSHT